MSISSHQIYQVSPPCLLGDDIVIVNKCARWRYRSLLLPPPSSSRTESHSSVVGHRQCRLRKRNITKGHDSVKKRVVKAAVCVTSRIWWYYYCYYYYYLRAQCRSNRRQWDKNASRLTVLVVEGCRYVAKKVSTAPSFRSNDAIGSGTYYFVLSFPHDDS